MRAKDLFPDEVDEMVVSGARVRKGSIAAFAHNALTLEHTDPSSEEHSLALADLHRILPALQKAGLFEVFRHCPKTRWVGQELCRAGL